MDRDTSLPRRLASRAACAAGALALAASPCARAQSDGSTLATPPPGTASATLEQCLTSPVQAERSATFTGEMTAIPGTARMSMRIDLEERAPGELEYHTVTFNGLGLWRSSDPRVKVYRYVKQVTNLSAPASYRGLVRFRWMSAKGHVVKRAERLTAHCAQPAPAAEPAPPAATPPSEGTPPSTPTSPSATAGATPGA
jgi:hypothetical protein